MKLSSKNRRIQANKNIWRCSKQANFRMMNIYSNDKIAHVHETKTKF